MAQVQEFRPPVGDCASATKERPRAQEMGRAPWLYRCLLALGRWVLSRLFMIEVRGERSVPAGGFLLASNHLNWIDPFILMAVLPTEPRLHFVANQDRALDRWWKRAVIGAVGGVIPLRTGSRRSHEEMLSRAYAVLQVGGACGIFPEGRTGTEEGKLLPFKKGLGHLAVHTGAPVVPVAISGTSELYLGRRITVTIGNVVPLGDESLALKHRAEVTVQRVRSSLEAMLVPYEEPVGVVKRWRWLTHLL